MTTYLATTYLADHHGYGWHPWPFFWIFPVVFWLLVATAVVLVARRGGFRDPGVATLRAAFARGEISEQDYLNRLDVLRRTRRRRTES
ncbi:hypothetical protein [Nocardia veterana]|uniref:SHOCT domain-containing protein n=1 Tax=Nocardia veterana TaxID=132249 RepID=A0A7X6LTS9_9NOCA|nr:hypothetical protein [Nocardia veterana]NKY84332.1 hypothetical protein [Nocardia veterana]